MKRRKGGIEKDEGIRYTIGFLHILHGTSNFPFELNLGEAGSGTRRGVVDITEALLSPVFFVSFSDFVVCKSFQL